VSKNTKAFPKNVIEENIIKGYQNDCEKFLIVHQKFELDDVDYNILCEFKSHSHMLLVRAKCVRCPSGVVDGLRGKRLSGHY
jgi:hypothetical protein